MGFFSLFRKQKPDDVYRKITQKIVLACLKYRIELQTQNNQLSADGAAELAYLLLHLLDRSAFELLGDRRDIVFDTISQMVVSEYVKSVMKPDTPPSVTMEVALRMMDDLNARQVIYSQCKEFIGELAGPGTTVFAFCFFVHRALGNTVKTDADDILTGNRKVEMSEIGDMPEFETVHKDVMHLSALLVELDLPTDLKLLI